MKHPTPNPTVRLFISVILGGLFAARGVSAATLADIGASAPSPGANDISQLLTTGANASTDGLNYYDNNNPACGQTFTTGANTTGYTLSSLAYEYGSLNGSSHNTSQSYTLRIYSVGAGATLLASYTATATVTISHWVKWTGLSVLLQPNMTYAYTITDTTGYEQLIVASGNPYAAGEIVQIPNNGGVGVSEAITTGPSHSFDAAFDAGLSLGGAVAVANSDHWNGASGSGNNWSDPANWNGSTPAPGDFLTFDGSARTSPNNDLTSYTFGNIAFAPSITAAFTLGGNAITLGNTIQDASDYIYGGGIWNLSTNSLTETVNLPVTIPAGNHLVGSGSGGQLALAGTITRSTGTTVEFFTNGVVNVTGSGLAADGSSGGGILGGWAVIGTGNDLGNWATINGSGNVVSYSGYTSEAASFTTVAGGNFKVTQNNTTTKITQASGSFVDMNTLLCNPGTSHGETIEANTAADPIRLGVEGAIMNIDGNSQTIFIGGGSTYFLTAGGATANNPGELTLAQLGNGAGNLQINCVIENNGSGAVTVNQMGSVNYDFPNTYTGSTYLNYGEGYLQSGAKLGNNSAPIYVYPGARLDFGGINGGYTIANTIYIAGYGSYEAGANNPAALKGSYNGIISGLITLLGSAQIDPNAGALPNTCTFSGGFAGTGSLTIGGANVDTAGNATFGGNCSYTGNTIIDATANKGGGSGIIISSGMNNIMNGVGGSLNLLGGSSGVALFDLNGTAQTVNGLATPSGTAANVLVRSSGSAGTLTVSNTASSSFGGILTNGTGTLAFSTIGTGTLTLSGANTYTGSTIVGNGTLVLSGPGSISGSTSVSVSNATLNVSGVTGGTWGLGAGQSLAVTNGTVTANSITANSSTTVSLTNSTLNLSTSLLGRPATPVTTLNLSNSTVNLTAASSSTTNLSAGTFNGSGTITFNITNGPIITSYPANFCLVSAATALNNSATFNVNLLAPASPPYGYAVVTTGNAIYLSITNGPRANEAVNWNGIVTSDGNWTLSTSEGNWLGTGTTYYQNGDFAVFGDDSASGAETVNLNAVVAPGSLTFDNNNVAYTISGTGYISGATALTNAGPGSVTLSESGGDTFSGGVVVNGGTVTLDNAGSAMTGGAAVAGGATLQVGNNDAHGSLPGSVTDNGSLIFNRSDTALAVSTVISGTGGVTNSGSGTVTLTANNSVSGGVTVNNGTLQVNSVGSGNSSLGSGNTTVNPGGILTGGGSDAFGYGANNNPVTIVIAGGMVTDLGSSSYRVTLPNLQFSGGTLTNASGNSGDADGNYSLFGTNAGCAVTTLASSTTATISAGSISFQEPTTFNIASGSTSSGVDLLVTSVLKPYGSEPMTKTGAGVMALDASSPANLGTVTVSQGTLQLGTGGDAGNLTAPMGSGNVANSSELNFASSQAVTVSNTITGTGSNVVSSGTANFYGTNSTYAGGTFVNGGYAVANLSPKVFGAGLITVFSGGQISYGKVNVTTVTNSIVIAGNGPAGLGAIKGDFNGTFTGPITLTGNASIDPNAGIWPNTSTFSNTISGTGSLTIGGANTNLVAGIATIANNLTYTGDTILDATANNNSGAGMAFKGNNLMQNGGNLILVGGSGKPASFNLNGTAQTINGLFATNGTVADAAVTNSSVTAATLTAGNNDANGIFGGVIENGDGGVALTKIGAGTLNLSGVNTATGTTTISNGVLALSGSGALASASIIIGANATLDVSGVTGGAYSLTSAQTLTGNGATGTIAGSLTLATGSSLVLNYTNGMPSLCVTNGTLAFNSNAVTITVSGSALGAGSYLLISTNAGGLVTGTLPAAVTINGTGLTAGTGAVLEMGGGQLYLVASQPVAAPMTVYRQAGTSLLISLADVATNWSDADGGTVAMSGINLVTTNSVTLQTNSGWILYPSSAPNLNDQFSYTVTDSYGGTNTGVVNIVVNNSAVFGQNATVSISGSTATVSFAGIPGYNYGVQRSTNLTDWVTILTTNAPSNGLFNCTDNFSDLGAVPASAYYRLQWNP